jgi:hypothetical protein
MTNQDRIYSGIATSLRDFGYTDVTPQMVRETHEAMQKDEALPHGIVGMFASRQLEEAAEAGVIER